MYACIAHHALKLLGRIEQFPHLGIGVVGLLHCRRILDGIFQFDIELVGHHLGDAVDIAVGHIHGATHILDRCLSGHGAERDDLCHVLASILRGDVIDDLASPVHAEIDVDVRHGDSFRVQKTFEQQFVLERIEVGDAHRVRH